MPLTPEQITIIGLLLAIGAAGLTKVWVFGWVYRDKEQEVEEMRVDRDFWKDLALGRLTSDADTARAARSFVLSPEESSKAEKAVREAGK